MKPQVWTTCVSPELRAELEAGRRIIVAARNSSTGKDPRRVAADDLVEAVAALKDRVGIDVTSLLPNKGTLMELLRSAETRRTMSTARKPLKHQFVEIDGLAEVGALLIVSCGSGTSLDEDLQQPAIKYVARHVGALKPALVWAKRLDRIGRDPLALGPLLTPLREYGPSWIGDEENGIQSMADPMTAFMVFFRATSARIEAKNIPKKTRTGQIANSGTELENGRVAYRYAGSLPPGLVRIRLRDGAKVGPPWAYLDTPRYLPARDAAASGLPEVYDDSGEHVDQVENVRWFWERYALGDKQFDIARGLAARRYSTDNYRRNHGPSATLPIDITPGNCHSWVRLIRNWFDFYSTGKLPVRLGVDGVPDQVIAIEPPDGPWIPNTYLLAIRKRLEREERMREVRDWMTFAGTHLTYNGVPCIALTRGATDVQLRGDCYDIQTLESYPRGHKKPPGHRFLSHQELAASLFEGVGSALGRPVHAVQDAAKSPESRLLAGDVEQLDAEIRRLEAKQEERAQLLEERDETGARTVTGALLRRLDTEFNAAAGKLDDLRRTVILKREELDRPTQLASGVRVDRMSEFVARVRNPYDKPFRLDFPHALHHLEVTTERISTSGHEGWLTSWSGELHLDDGEKAWSIPFSGSCAEGSAALADHRIEEVIAAMRGGTPFWSSPLPRLNELYKSVAKRLGSAGSLLAGCSDPRILRIAVALHVDRKSISATATEFGETEAFVSRVHHRFTGLDFPDTWFRKRVKTRDAMCVLAALKQGAASYDDLIPRFANRTTTVYQVAKSCEPGTWENMRRVGFRLLPCPHEGCGSLRRAYLGIDEPVGPVCLVCRRDLAGFEWSADPYDAYVSAKELWHELSGGAITFPSANPPSQRRSSPERRSRRSAGRADGSAFVGHRVPAQTASPREIPCHEEKAS